MMISQILFAFRICIACQNCLIIHHNMQLLKSGNILLAKILTALRKTMPTEIMLFFVALLKDTADQNHRFWTDQEQGMSVRKTHQ